MSRLIALLTLTILLWISHFSYSADCVFQYAAPAVGARAKSMAFLWIPPEAKQVRGIVVAGMTLAERELVKDERIRDACAQQGLAIVFCTTGLGSIDIQKTLDEMAKISGYRELSSAPLFFIGHSAGGPQAKAAALHFKDRCFGVMQYRGGAPGGTEPVPPGIPALMMVGQFDEFGGTMRDEAGRENWENARDALASYQQADRGNLGSIVVEPGAGHFAWSDRNAKYLALYLRKAAQARIPESPSDAIKATDPSSGWLSDLTIKTAGPHKPAPFKEFTGDKTKSAWHFDREMAEATAAYHNDGFGKKDQFIRWNDAYWVDAGARYYFNEIKWIGDGQTFVVHPAYADTYPRPQKDGKGPKWSQAGMPVGHADVPIRVRCVSGPVVALNDHSFRFKFDALAPATDHGRVTFLAFSEGDGAHRGSEHVGMLPRGFAGLTAGKDQKITFPNIEDLKANAPPLELKATSDAGLPVEYYVAQGPAVIEGGKLRISQVPARAVFPLDVKVVAYQFGRGIDPRVKSAVPVERSFRIVSP